MAALSALYPDILPYVPGCPDPMLDQEIRRAAREFCHRARPWLVWLSEITTVAGVRSYYAITLPVDAEVFRIQRATLDDQLIDVLVYAEHEADPATVPGQWPGVVSRDRQNVILMRDPAAGQKIKLQAVLAPSPTATTLDDTLVAQFGAAIVEGAKYRLMRVPGPLHKPKSAEEARLLFEIAIGAASHAAHRSQTNTTPRASVKWC